jgi:hypothetical protein
MMWYAVLICTQRGEDEFPGAQPAESDDARTATDSRFCVHVIITTSEFPKVRRSADVFQCEMRW